VPFLRPPVFGVPLCLPPVWSFLRTILLILFFSTFGMANGHVRLPRCHAGLR
jgi:hypothetical protein